MIIDPLEVKIVSILPYKNSNFQPYSPPLPFLTAVKKKMFCVSLLSVKEFLIYKFKLLSFVKRLYNMSSTIYIHDPLPVTP